MKKYEFTGKRMKFEGHTLHEIKYVNGPYKHKTGGWIESEHNFSHEGNCLILQNAKVFGNARVMDDAVVCTNAIVKDNAQVLSHSYIYGNAIVGADSIISGETKIHGESKVLFYADGEYGQPNIFGKSRILDSTIESTGTICNCNIIRKKMYGFLKLKSINI